MNAADTSAFKEDRKDRLSKVFLLKKTAADNF